MGDCKIEYDLFPPRDELMKAVRDVDPFGVGKEKGEGTGRKGKNKHSGRYDDEDDDDWGFSLLPSKIDTPPTSASTFLSSDDDDDDDVDVGNNIDNWGRYKLKVIPNRPHHRTPRRQLSLPNKPTASTTTAKTTPGGGGSRTTPKGRMFLVPSKALLSLPRTKPPPRSISFSAAIAAAAAAAVSESKSVSESGNGGSQQSKDISKSSSGNALRRCRSRSRGKYSGGSGSKSVSESGNGGSPKSKEKSKSSIGNALRRCRSASRGKYSGGSGSKSVSGSDALSNSCHSSSSLDQKLGGRRRGRRSTSRGKYSSRNGERSKSRGKYSKTKDNKEDSSTPATSTTLLPKKESTTKDNGFLSTRYHAQLKINSEIVSTATKRKNGTKKSTSNNNKDDEQEEGSDNSIEDSLMGWLEGVARQNNCDNISSNSSACGQTTKSAPLPLKVTALPRRARRRNPVVTSKCRHSKSTIGSSTNNSSPSYETSLNLLSLDVGELAQKGLIRFDEDGKLKLVVDRDFAAAAAAAVAAATAAEHKEQE